LYKQPNQSNKPKALKVASNGHKRAANPSKGLLRVQSIPTIVCFPEDEVSLKK